MANRKAIPLKIQLAAALLQLVDAKGERLIPYADSKMMTAAQIVSLFELDHYPFRVADGGISDPWNLTWRLRAEHKRKTATIDQPELGKQRRIRAREAEHKIVLRTKTTDELLNIHGPEKCHICGKPRAATGEIYCSYPHGMLPDKPIGDGHSVWTWKKPYRKMPSRPFPKGRGFAKRA